MSLILSAVVSFLVSLSTCLVFFLISKKKTAEEKQEKIIQPAAQLQNAEPEESVSDHSEPIKDFTFDNFCAEDPTFVIKMKSMMDDYSATNPVILKGPTGLGKTHLMRAFQNYLLEKEPSKKICFISAEALTNEFVDSVEHNTTSAFTEKFRNLEALFIDDFDYLRHRDYTQEFLYYTLADLLEKKTFICLALTTPASLKKGFFDKLVTLINGFQIDIPYPSFDAKRKKILQTFEKSNCFINGDLVDYLAKPEIGIHELTGICQKIILMKNLEGKGCVNLEIDDVKDFIK